MNCDEMAIRQALAGRGNQQGLSNVPAYIQDLSLKMNIIQLKLDKILEKLEEPK